MFRVQPPGQRKTVRNKIIQLLLQSSSMLTIGALSTNALAAELAVNGSMSNNASGWNKYTMTASKLDSLIYTRSGVTLPGTNSTTLMVMDTRELGMTALTNNVYQTVNLQPNKRYRISFSARTEEGLPGDLFVRIFEGTDVTKFNANTIVTRRVRVSDDALTRYNIDFETGSKISGAYTLSFSGRSYGTYTQVLGAKIGFTDVSLVDDPTNKSITVLEGSKVSLDVNQIGYMGKNKPFFFTLSGLPQGGKVTAISLTRVSDTGWETGVQGENTGRPIFGSVVSDKFDLESSQRVITMQFDTTSATKFPTLVDDLADSKPNSPTFSNRQRGYKVLVNVEYPGRANSYSTDMVTKRATLQSPLFPISKNIYAKLSTDALKYFPANTAGKSGPGYSTALDDPAKQEQYRVAGHVNSDKIATCRTGVDRFGNDFTFSTEQKFGCKNAAGSVLSMDVSGGWYDAGDQGKYVVNGGVALWTLQNQIERLQKKYYSLDADKKIALLGQITVMMNTAKEEMDFMLRMQAPAGTKAMVPLGYQGIKLYDNSNTPKDYGYFHTDANPTFGEAPTQLSATDQGSINFRGGKLPRLALKLKLTEADVSGMVFHSVTDDDWTSLPTAPAEDNLKRVLTYPTSAATFNMAAVAAQAFRIWSWPELSSTAYERNPFDNTSISRSDYAKLCLTRGFTAYSAAKTRYENTDHKNNPSNIYRYEYSHDSWYKQDLGAFNLNGVKFSDGKTYSDAGPNFPWLAVGFSLPPQWLGGGAYGDYRIRDEYYWASMEMFLAATHVNAPEKLSDTKVTPKKVDAAFKEFISFVPQSSWSSTTEKGHPSSVYSGFVDNAFLVSSYSWAKGFDWQNVAPLGTLSSLAANPSFSEGAKALQDKEINIKNDAGTTVFKTAFSPRANTITAADTFKSFVNDQAYRFAKNPIKTNVYDSSKLKDESLDQLHNRDWMYEWGSNGNIINRAIILAYAYDLTNDRTYADAALLSMDYVMGRNANSVSFVTGYGSNPVRGAHHRFWAKIIDPKYPAAPDGVLLGGPNSRDITAIIANASHYNSTSQYDTQKNIVDSVEKGLLPDTIAIGKIDPKTGKIELGQSKDDLYFLEKAVANTGCITNDFKGGATEIFAPQKCFVDHPQSFASSEVAINWNAPLGWIARYLNEYAQVE